MRAAQSPDDVVVVGAGLSGLTAARELHRAGLDVLVLEARDRPGGRTHAARVDGVTVDLGGEWVDAAHAEIRDLIGELGIGLRPSVRRKEDARWYVGGVLSGEMPLSGRDAAIHRRMSEALVETASGVDPDAPWRDAPWRDAPAEDTSVEEWLRGAGMSEGGVRVVEALVSSCGSTVPLRDMSFYSYAVKVATRGGPGKGNEFRVEGGAGGIAAALARGLGGRVRYSSPVVGIRRGGSGVEVRYVGEGGPGEVRARRVVMAVPFACYRGIRFDPEPPPVFRRAISGSLYGVVRKMFFFFGEPVDASTFAVTDTPLGYCTAAAQASGEEPRAIVSFAGGSPLLPELGRPEEVRKRRAVELLRRLYDVPEPVAVIEKSWTAEHFSRGSYMIMAPGDMRTFGEAMGGSFGAVRLAGAEGVAAAPSFMNSAVKAGLRAGREMAEDLLGSGSTGTRRDGRGAGERAPARNTPI